MKDLGLNRYLGSDLNAMSIADDLRHQGESPALSKEVPVQLKSGNQAANSLVKNQHIHERSKHIDVAYHYVRDLARSNLVQLDYVPSSDTVTDGMTKPLPKDRFKAFMR